MRVSLENSLNLMIIYSRLVLRSLILNLNRKSKPKLVATIILNERDTEAVNLESQIVLASWKTLIHNTRLAIQYNFRTKLLLRVIKSQIVGIIVHVGWRACVLVHQPNQICSATFLTNGAWIELASDY
jgi:hypothetical protein